MFYTRSRLHVLSKNLLFCKKTSFNCPDLRQCLSKSRSVNFRKEGYCAIFRLPESAPWECGIVHSEKNFAKNSVSWECVYAILEPQNLRMDLYTVRIIMSLMVKIVGVIYPGVLVPTPLPGYTMQILPNISFTRP